MEKASMREGKVGILVGTSQRVDRSSQGGCFCSVVVGEASTPGQGIGGALRGEGSSFLE